MSTNDMHDRRTFMLDGVAYRNFIERLNAPPRRNEKLRRLLTTKVPWEVMLKSAERRR